MSLEFDKTFAGLCLSGNALMDDIETYVKNWHEGAPSSENCELSDWLGFTHAEYWAWVRNPIVLAAILSAKRTNTNFEIFLEEISEQRAAARGMSGPEAEELLNWLRSNRLGQPVNTPRYN